MGVVVRGPELAVGTCARRLAPLGAVTVRAADGEGAADCELVLEWADGPAAGAEVEVDLSWYGTAAVPDRHGSEIAVQARSGLMQVHGRDAGGPRRLGLEVASVAAGVLAAHATAAALVGHARGATVERVETSVLEAGLLLSSHRIAAATCGSEWAPAPAGPAPGPPFRSADGVWFEIETMDPSMWKVFWERLGAADADLGRAWTLFRSRYFRGTCTLPPGLHEATAARPLAEIAAVAAACDVSLCPLRSYEQVLEEFGSWAGEVWPQPVGGGADVTRSGQPAGGALPLTGLRVVEATSRLQGPLAGRVLQLLGASVVRVEPPGGDLSRTIPPLVGETGTFFLCFNRGKETVEIDLSRAAGRAQLFELVAGADVFLQNWKPGKAAEWGLDARAVARANPAVVYAHASGWGDREDLSHLVGTDYLVQAYAAVGAGINPLGEPPFPSRALLTDYMGALVTAEALLAALYAREASGRGQRVEPSLLAGAVALQAHVFEALAAGREKGRRGGRPVWTRLDQPLPTADGVLAMDVEDDEDVQLLRAACGIEPAELSWDALERAVLDRLAQETTGDWERALTAAGISCAPVSTDLAAIPRDPSLSALFEPLGELAHAPVGPWRLQS